MQPPEANDGIAEKAVQSNGSHSQETNHIAGNEDVRGNALPPPQRNDNRKREQGEVSEKVLPGEGLNPPQAADKSEQAVPGVGVQPRVLSNNREDNANLDIPDAVDVPDIGDVNKNERADNNGDIQNAEVQGAVPPVDIEGPSENKSQKNVHSEN